MFLVMLCAVEMSPPLQDKLYAVGVLYLTSFWSCQDISTSSKLYKFCKDNLLFNVFSLSIHSPGSFL